MLNAYSCPVALSARVRLLRWGLPFAMTGMLVMPWANAADTMAMPKEMTMAPATPLGQYQKWRDEPLNDWTQSNDRVGEIGGWLTYLRDAQQGDGTAEPSSHSHHGH